MKKIRPVSWIKAARKDFDEFPQDVQDDMLDALTIAAEGGKSDNAKPFKGIDGGVFEISLQYRGDAFVLFTLSKLIPIFGCYTHFKRNQKRELKHRKWMLNLFITD